MAITINVKLFPGAIAFGKQALAAAAKGITPHEATMGVHEEDGTKAKKWYDGRDQVETLAEIMTLHEYGDAGVPERSWLRSWFDSNMTRLAGGMFDAMRREADGDKSAIQQWVVRTHAEWKSWIDGGHLKPLSPFTEAVKASYGLPRPEAPLIATQQFIEALRAKLDGRRVA